MTRRYILIAAATLAVACATAALRPAPAPDAFSGASEQAALSPKESTPVDSVAEAVAEVFGTHVRRSLADLAVLGVDVDREKFLQAFSRVLEGEPGPMDFETANAFLTAHIDSRRPRTAGVDTLSVASQQAFVDSMAALPGAVTTPSGLVFIEERPGSGNSPSDTDDVEVMYLGRFFDGVQFDYTDRPVTFNVANLTPGFSEGLKLMRPGGQYRLIIPANLGYGPEGIPGAIPGNAALDFIVDLIKVK